MIILSLILSGLAICISIVAMIFSLAKNSEPDPNDGFVVFGEKISTTAAPDARPTTEEIAKERQENILKSFQNLNDSEPMNIMREMLIRNNFSGVIETRSDDVVWGMLGFHKEILFEQIDRFVVIGLPENLNFELTEIHTPDEMERFIRWVLAEIGNKKQSI